MIQILVMLCPANTRLQPTFKRVLALAAASRGINIGSLGSFERVPGMQNIYMSERSRLTNASMGVLTYGRSPSEVLILNGTGNPVSHETFRVVDVNFPLSTL